MSRFTTLLVASLAVGAYAKMPVFDSTDPDNFWSRQVNVQKPGAVNLGAVLNTINNINASLLFDQWHWPVQDAGTGTITMNFHANPSGEPKSATFVNWEWETLYASVYGTHQYWPDLFGMGLQTIGYDTYMPNLQYMEISSAFLALTGEKTTVGFNKADSDLDAEGLGEWIAKGAIGPDLATPTPRAPMILITGGPGQSGKLRASNAYTIYSVKAENGGWGIGLLHPSEEDAKGYTQQEVFDAAEQIIIVDAIKPHVAG